MKADQPKTAAADRSNFIIQLWGDTSVGKTMLISTAFGDDTGRELAFPTIDFTDPGTRLDRFKRNFRQMSRGRLVLPTAQSDFQTGTDELVVDLVTRDGKRVSVRDIKGGVWLEWDEAQRRALATETDALLFLIAWDKATVIHRLRAVHDLLPYLGAHLRAENLGLAFTQCDRALPLSLHRCRWGDLTQIQGMRSDPVVAEILRYREMFHRDHGGDFFEATFGERIWFTSAWGYSGEAEDGSASVLTDFGDALPCQVRPVGVRKPFSALLARFGLA